MTRMKIITGTIFHWRSDRMKSLSLSDLIWSSSESSETMLHLWKDSVGWLQRLWQTCLSLASPRWWVGLSPPLLVHLWLFRGDVSFSFIEKHWSRILDLFLIVEPSLFSFHCFRMNHSFDPLSVAWFEVQTFVFAFFSPVSRSSIIGERKRGPHWDATHHASLKRRTPTTEVFLL